MCVECVCGACGVVQYVQCHTLCVCLFVGVCRAVSTFTRDEHDDLRQTKGKRTNDIGQKTSGVTCQIKKINDARGGSVIGN